MNTELSTKDLQAALGMSNAVNALAIINWLRNRIEQISRDDSKDAEMVRRIGCLQEAAQNAYRQTNSLDALRVDEQYLKELADVWWRCWGKARWYSYSHPVLKLTVQVLASIAQDERSENGLADFGEYENAVNDVQGMIRTRYFEGQLEKMRGQNVTVFFSDDDVPCAQRGELQRHGNGHHFVVSGDGWMLSPAEVTGINFENGIITIQ